MQESTYSSLSEPVFDALKDGDISSGDALSGNVQAYETFLNSLELQHRARKIDNETTTQQIASVEKEIAQLEDEYERKTRELEALKSNADKQRGLMQLAHKRFESPVHVTLDDARVSLVLNKTAAQLDEDHHFLEEQVEQLEDELSNVMAEFDRRADIVNELHDAVVEIRERYENPDAFARSSREPESGRQGSKRGDEDEDENGDEYDQGDGYRSDDQYYPKGTNDETDDRDEEEADVMRVEK